MNKLGKLIPILLIIAVIGSMCYSSFIKKGNKKAFDPSKQKITVDSSGADYIDSPNYNDVSSENFDASYSFDIEAEQKAYEEAYHPPLDLIDDEEYSQDVQENQEVTVDLSNGLVIDDNTAKSILFGELDSYIEAGYIDKNLADTFINSDYVASVQNVNIEFGGISESGNEYSFVYSLDCTSDFYKREFGVLKIRVEDNKITYIHKFVTETFKE